MGMGISPEKFTTSYPAQTYCKAFPGDVKAVHGGEINVCARADGFSFLHCFSGSANLRTPVLSHIAHCYFWRHLSKSLFPWGIVIFNNQDVTLHLFK